MKIAQHIHTSQKKKQEDDNEGVAKVQDGGEKPRVGTPPEVEVGSKEEEVEGCSPS